LPSIYENDDGPFPETAYKVPGSGFIREKSALYSTLIRMANSYGVECENGILLDIPINHQELANFSSTSRESITRELNHLQSKGVISKKGRKIVIHSLDYLKRQINCEGCPVEYCVIN